VPGRQPVTLCRWPHNQLLDVPPPRRGSSSRGLTQHQHQFTDGMKVSTSASSRFQRQCRLGNARPRFLDLGRVRGCRVRSRLAANSGGSVAPVVEIARRASMRASFVSTRTVMVFQDVKRAKRSGVTQVARGGSASNEVISPVPAKFSSGALQDNKRARLVWQKPWQGPGSVGAALGRLRHDGDDRHNTSPEQGGHPQARNSPDGR